MVIRYNLLDLLSHQLSAAPKPYGPFHLVAFALTIAIAIFIAIRYHHPTEKQNKTIVLSISILLLMFEVYKQLVFSYNNGNWTYQWYAFPFQFCSVPMYVGLLAGLLKEGKVRRALYSFLGTFCLFAGLAVMVYPNDVFTSTLGISIQTMVHHGGMTVLGIYCITSNRVLPEAKRIVGSGLVFLTLVAIAQTINLLLKSKGLSMFFISPYVPCHLPVLSMIQATYGYIVFIFTYIFGFIFVAFLILSITILIKKVWRQAHPRNSSQLGVSHV